MVWDGVAEAESREGCPRLAGTMRLTVLGSGAVDGEMNRAG